MATTAQIEANRRNCRKSSGPKTVEGKIRSRSNALDHGCRANILVLPTEIFGEYENELQAWRLSFKPRNPSEEFLIDGILRLRCLSKRIDRAHTARLATRINSAAVEVADTEHEQVTALGQRLFQHPNAPQAADPTYATGKSARDVKTHRTEEFCIDPDDPMRLVRHLERTGTGCEWLLGQWDELRGLLERDVNWLAPDKLKAVRLLGLRTTGAVDSEEVAVIYLASHVLMNHEGNPFQEILDELAPDRAPIYENFLKQRHYESLAPKDRAAAKQLLLDVVDQATDWLQEKAEALQEMADLNAPYTADRLSWDDTPEGERLRRYQLTCQRASSRMFDLLLNIRSRGAELDIATIDSLRRSVPTVALNDIDLPMRTVADVITPPAEPVQQADPPSEPNLAEQKAPNEANSHVQAPSQEGREGHKELRIDTPHLDRKPGGIGTTGKVKSHPVLERVLTARNSTLLNLTSIFGEQ